jgi:hypothetical protein
MTTEDDSKIENATEAAAGKEIFEDEDGAHYLHPCQHEAIAGKEFLNQMHLIETIQDWEAANSTFDKAGQPIRSTKFSGEVILLEVLTF